jgi:hypothetical protein
MSAFEEIKNQANFKLITDDTIEIDNRRNININKNVTFFPYRNVFRKHTPFGLHKMYLEVILPDLTGECVTGGTNVRWVNNVGHALIKEISLKLNGKEIEKHDSIWMDIWNEITDVEEKEYGLIGKEISIIGTTPDTDFYNNKTKWYIPLHFFFTKNPALSLPTFLLNTESIKVDITLRDLKELVHYDGAPAALPTINTSGTNKHPEIRLFTGNFYLDNAERQHIRNKFVNKGYEFLIEVPERLIHEESVGSTTYTANLDNRLDYPIKEFYWVFRHKDRITAGTGDPPSNVDVPDYQNDTGGNQIFAYYGATENSSLEGGIGTRDTFTTLELKIGGKNILEETKKSDYFRTMQPYYYHPKIDTRYIYNYSFALKPLDYQPSGFLYMGSDFGNRARFDFTGVLSSDYRFNLYSLGYRILQFTKLNGDKLDIFIIKGNSRGNETRNRTRSNRENTNDEKIDLIEEAQEASTTQEQRSRRPRIQTFQNREKLQLNSSLVERIKNAKKGPWGGLAGGQHSDIGNNGL